MRHWSATPSWAPVCTVGGNGQRKQNELEAQAMIVVASLALPARYIGAILCGSRQVDDLQVVLERRIAIGADLDFLQNHDMVLIEGIELYGVIKAGNLLGLESGRSANPRCDRLHLVNALGGNLHAAAAAIGHQQVILAILLVDDHVERDVTIS